MNHSARIIDPGTDYTPILRAIGERNRRKVTRKSVVEFVSVLVITAALLTLYVVLASGAGL